MSINRPSSIINRPSFYVINHPFSAFCREIHSTIVENIRQIRLFMQNKPNSPIVHFFIRVYMIIRYEYFISLAELQNKANSNPIKANSNPIASKSKMNASARKSGHTMKYCYFLAKIYHPIRVPISRVSKAKQTQFLTIAMQKRFEIDSNYRIINRY